MATRYTTNLSFRLWNNIQSNFLVIKLLSSFQDESLVVIFPTCRSQVIMHFNYVPFILLCTLAEKIIKPLEVFLQVINFSIRTTKMSIWGSKKELTCSLVTQWKYTFFTRNRGYFSKFLDLWRTSLMMLTNGVMPILKNKVHLKFSDEKGLKSKSHPN